MKQYTNNLLAMNFKGVDMEDVSKIEFAFSQEIDGAPLKTAEYPTRDASLIAGNVVGVAWTQADTAKFKAGEHFYADTRITLKSTSYQPETPIIKLKMNKTLFEQG